GISEPRLRPPLLLTQLQDAPHIFRGRVDGDGDDRLLDAVDVAFRGEFRGVVELDDLAVLEHAAKAHGRGGRYQVEVVLTLEPLLDDLHVQEPQEAAAKAEAERGRGLRLARERGVVEAQ